VQKKAKELLAKIYTGGSLECREGLKIYLVKDGKTKRVSNPAWAYLSANGYLKTDGSISDWGRIKYEMAG
jgi:hypothetical protein